MVSIITSLYRTDKYLSQFEQNLRVFVNALNSAQVDFELIVIANDATEVEKNFALKFKNENWFKFLEIGREPLYATWNRGAEMAKGEVMGFWNVDDVRFGNAIVEAEKLFQASAELVHFPFVIKRYLKLGSWFLPLPKTTINHQIPEFSSKTKSEFLAGMVCGPFFMFTKDLYNRVGPFDEQFKIAGDFDWCVRAVKVSDKVVKAKSLGGVFRVDGGGLSAGGSSRHIAENNVIYVRNHLWHKLINAEDLAIKNYRPHHLLHKGEYREI